MGVLHPFDFLTSQYPLILSTMVSFGDDFGNWREEHSFVLFLFLPPGYYTQYFRLWTSKSSTYFLLFLELTKWTIPSPLHLDR